MHDYNFCITTPPIFAFYSYMIGVRSFMQRKQFTRAVMLLCLLTLVSILPFLLTLAPFVNLAVDTLAKAKRLTHFYSVAPLLEKRFACFPTSGDSLRFLYFSLCIHLASGYHGKVIHSCRHSWAVGRIRMMIEEKNIIWLLAKNPASDNRKKCI